MMGRALLTVGWTATVGFVLTGVIGYRVDGPELFDLHLLLGLGSAFLLLFSHCWIMFYLIGTGKAIKQAVADHDLDDLAVERTKEFKNASYPPMLLAIGLAMATFILGGGVATKVLPGWVHWGLFWITLVAQLRALLIEGRVLGANRRLMDEVERSIGL